MAETASKSIYNWRRHPSLKCYEIHENLQFWIRRSAVVPSDTAHKTAIWCTIKVPHVHNNPKDILENLLPLWLLVHTNLFVTSHFWCTDAKFDNCCQRYVATCGKICIGAHLYSWL